MSKSISIDKIIDATLDGIKQSQRKYEKWTGGFWLCDGPEYLITINVAENIAKLPAPKEEDACLAIFGNMGGLILYFGGQMRILAQSLK